MRTQDFDYELPPELIAQRPLPDRAASRMLAVRRADGSAEHRHARDLPAFLNKGDLLVVNDTRVIPARLLGRRADTGGRVELLLVRETRADDSATGNAPGPAANAHRFAAEWEALYGASGKARPGLRLTLEEGALAAEILAATAGRVQVRLEGDEPISTLLERVGRTPLPPYIARAEDENDGTDRARYQTVYARAPGAVAAPTAGLHLDEALLAALAEAGIATAAVTLHVGPGTFRPVKADRIEDHVMEAERYVVSDETVAAINDARDRGGRVVAVGSTAVRTLETAAARRGFLVAGAAESELFIRPPFRFRIVDALLTNFHLPRSTLLMMVAAFLGAQPDGAYADSAGRRRLLDLYAEAVRQRYRFFSYGDCMLIL